MDIFGRMKALDRPNIKTPARTISIISGKGGVGKTHLAINLALRFSQTGRRVLVVDTDLGSANADIRVGATPTTTLVDFYNGKAEIECCTTNTRYDFEIIAGKPGDFAMANLPDEQIIRLLMAFDKLIKNGRYSDIIFDLGAGISSRVLDFALVTDEIIILTTPNEIIHGYASLKACWTRFLNLQGNEFYKERAAISKTPYYLREGYRGDGGAPRINFVLNQVDNLEQGKRIYLAMTKIAKKFFYTKDGFWNLPMRYLGGIPSAYDFLKRAERKQCPALALNPHHELSYAVSEVAEILLARKVIAPDKLRRTFGDKVRSVVRTWATAN